MISNFNAEDDAEPFKKCYSEMSSNLEAILSKNIRPKNVSRTNSSNEVIEEVKEGETPSSSPYANLPNFSEQGKPKAKRGVFKLGR